MHKQEEAEPKTMSGYIPIDYNIIIQMPVTSDAKWKEVHRRMKEKYGTKNFVMRVRMEGTEPKIMVRDESVRQEVLDLIDGVLKDKYAGEPGHAAAGWHPDDEGHG